MVCLGSPDGIVLLYNKLMVCLGLWFPRWYRGSTPLTPSSGAWTVGGSLVLGGLGLADGGEYTCVANNTAGETRFSAHLLVTSPLTVQV